MTTQAVDALRTIHRNFRTVLDGLSADDWNLPSACDGWTVKDMLAHVTSNQKEFVDPTPPPTDPMPEEWLDAYFTNPAPSKGWDYAKVPGACAK